MNTVIRDKAAWVTIGLFVGAFGLFWLTGAKSIGQLLDQLVAVYFLAWALYALLTEQSRTELRNSFVLCTVALVFLVCCLELLAMVYVVDYRQVFRASHPTSTLQAPGYDYKPGLLWVRQPQMRVVGRYTKGNEAKYFCLPPQAERKFDVQYDRNGFRNAANLSHADIVLVGDSYVEAPILEHSQSLAAQLAQLQGGTIANLGMSGYGPQQELHVLERLALPLRPHTVIWAFFEGNDILDVGEYERTVSSLASHKPFLVNFWFRSFTRNLLASLLEAGRSCASEEAAEQHKGIFVDAQGQEIPVYFMPRKELSAEDDWKVERAFTLVAQGASLTREQGIRHMVVFVPIKDRVLQGLPNVTPAPVLQRQTLDNLPQRLREFLAAEVPEAKFLDLTPVLRDAAARGSLPYFEDDTHWNAEGHRLAAEAIYRQLATQTTALR